LAFQLESPSFKNGEPMDPRFTCDGENLSPTLRWSDLPEGTKTLVLICDDPDAPGGTFTHWVVYNLPPSPIELREGLPTLKNLSNGTCQGLNSFNSIGYGGPCPPSGVHRYIFTLYAVGKTLDLEPGAKKSQVERAIQNRVVGKAELIGTYTRKK